MCWATGSLYTCHQNTRLMVWLGPRSHLPPLLPLKAKKLLLTIATLLPLECTVCYKQQQQKFNQICQCIMMCSWMSSCKLLLNTALCSQKCTSHFSALIHLSTACFLSWTNGDGYLNQWAKWQVNSLSWKKSQTSLVKAERSLLFWGCFGESIENSEWLVDERPFMES